MEKLTSNYAANAAELDLLLGVGRSCDMVSRDSVSYTHLTLPTT